MTNRKGITTVVVLLVGMVAIELVQHFEHSTSLSLAVGGLMLLSIPLIAKMQNGGKDE